MADDTLLKAEKEGVSARIYLDALTGLRGFAAAWVALWHVWGFAGRPEYIFQLGVLELDLTPLIRTGWAGVDIFFVLSGFVLGLPWCQAWLGNRPPIRLPEYFRRRLLRVLPAYYVQVLLLLLILYLSGSQLPKLGDLLAQLFMAHNLFLDDPARQLNPVYWTLPVEFDFYLLLPLMAALVLPKRWWRLLAAAVILVVAYRYLFFHYSLQGLSVGQKVWWLNQLPGRLDQFVSGMTAALAYSVIRQQGFTNSFVYRWRRVLLLLSTAGLLMLAWYIHRIQPVGATNVAGLTFWGGHWSLYVWHSLAGLFLGLLILVAALGTRVTDALLANRGMLFLGVVSYSLYLWHFPLIKWLQGLHLPLVVPDTPFFSLLLLVMVPVLAVSFLSYWWVERPFLKLRHHAQRDASTAHA